VCTFAVQTVVCGNIVGNASDPINITLYASETPATTTGPIDNPNLDTSYASSTTNFRPTDNPESHNLEVTENLTLLSIENLETHYNLDYSTETVGTHIPGTNTEFVTSIGLLATALMVCVVVFIIVTSVILIRSKAKIKAALQQSASQGETTGVEPVYEYITGSLPSELESDMNTKDNVAYGHTQAITRR
jgi:hypothetical protein